LKEGEEYPADSKTLIHVEDEGSAE